MHKLSNFIEKNISNILTFFIIIQPFLDVITGLTVNILKVNIPFAPVVRLIFMLICIYYTLFIYKDKKYCKDLFIIFIYLFIFCLSILVYRKNYLVYEITNLLNSFYLPFILIGMLSMFKHKKIKLDIKIIVITYLIYIFFIIFPSLTHTAFSSYRDSKVGYVGWFPLANIIGNSLTILLPILFYYLFNLKKKLVLKLVITAVVLYVFASIGTKVPILGLFICIVFNLIYYYKKCFLNKKYKSIIISCIASIFLFIISLIIIPKTSFYKNIEIHKNFLGINNYSEVFTNYKFLDHFVFSQRLTFLSTIHNSNKDCGIFKKLVGIGYVKNYGDEVSTKTIEIDYFDVFYQNGVIGTAVFFYVLISFFFRAFKNIKKSNLLNNEYRISMLLMILIAFFAGHMFISPAVAIYVALVLVCAIEGGLNEKIN